MVIGNSSSSVTVPRNQQREVWLRGIRCGLVSVARAEPWQPRADTVRIPSPGRVRSRQLRHGRERDEVNNLS
jgi:hypothetical protein